MPGGRPTDYNDSYIEALSELGYEGEGMAEAIVKLGISRGTFYNWQEEHPEFLDAVKEFRSRSQSWWERQGRKHTFNKGEGFSATSYIFNMKNRFPDDWRDKQEIDNKHDVADPVKELFAQISEAGKRIGT